MAKEGIRDDKLDTIIGPGTQVEGTINVHGGVRIDGKFTGTLKVEGLLVVGKSGSLEGEIFVKNAAIAGKVKGKTMIEEKVELQSGAKFDGELTCKGLVIEEGVIFDGSCTMSKKEAPAVERKQEKKSLP